MSKTVVPNTIVTVNNIVKILIMHKGKEYECLVDKYIYYYYRLDLYRWGILSNGYVYTNIKGKDGKQTKLYLHRLVTDCPKDLFVDHCNHDTLNNTLENLRLVTHHQNNMNKNKRIDNSIGIKGVRWHNHTNKWQSRIWLNYKEYSLGLYENIFDATIIRVLADLQVFGEMSYYNNINNIIRDLKLALDIQNNNI